MPLEKSGKEICYNLVKVMLTNWKTNLKKVLTIRKIFILTIVIILLGIALSVFLFNRFSTYHPSTAGVQKTITNSGYSVNSKELNNIPYLEIPAKIQKGNIMALLYSGDGGWGFTEQPLSQELAKVGIPVIGFNSPRYFFNPLTPVRTADDAENIIRYYMNLWNKKEIILIGYSYGADIAPYILNRLSPDLSPKIKTLVLMAPTKTIEFSVRGNGIFGIHGLPTYNVQDEVNKIKNTKIICFYGVGETDTLCKNLQQQKNIVILTHTGGHQIGNNYADLFSELRITP